MSRVQLALNVSDLDESIAFYTRLFQTPPAKVRDGYANFSIAEPPLKLILFAGAGEPGSLNHIDGFDQDIQENVSCCFAVQDKTWVQGPDNAWEFYTVLGDAPSMACDVSGPSGCVGEAESTGEAESADVASRCC